MMDMGMKAEDHEGQELWFLDVGKGVTEWPDC